MPICISITFSGPLLLSCKIRMDYIIFVYNLYKCIGRLRFEQQAQAELMS